MAEKLCTGCWKWQGRGSFTRDRRSADGLSAQCHVCQSLARRRRARQRRDRDARRGQLAFAILETR